MKIPPLGHNFHNQIPDWKHESFTGRELFHEATNVYLWYVSSSWLSQDTHSTTSPRNVLSKIKRIAEVSMGGGYYLTEEQETQALYDLKEVFQDLNDGKLNRDDLYQQLNTILLHLIETNPKAKLISIVTELEYLLCVHPKEDQPHEITKEHQTALSQIVEKVSPSLKEMNAHAVAQGLTQLVENFNSVTNFHEAIRNATHHWI